MRNADPTYQIGRGKAGELASLVKELDAEKIIFDNDLKPIQSYNLAKITGIEAIDRFQLILEIFAKRASTTEAQFQVQLASLRYQLPRARESVKLAKMGEQPGFLGLGRYEIDVYLEAIKRQIAHIRKELKAVREKRSLHRTRRLDYGLSSVSLAGYTSAGKTTLFNTLASESKSVDGGLFTTLSTTTRSVNFLDRRVLLTDTVGFVDRMPLVLIEAFHSTLEETVLSNVIILVVDLNEPINEIYRKLNSSIDTLNEIGAYEIPIVTALNKTDLLSSGEVEEKLSSLGELARNPVPVSALCEVGLEELKQKVIDCLERQIEAFFSLPVSDEANAFISGLYNQVNVIYTHYKGKEVKFRVRGEPWLLEKVRGQVERLGGRLLETNNCLGI